MRVSGLLSLPSPPPRPTHPRLAPPSPGATVEVVSGRGMTANLTGVEPYLDSLHSRFCFKGFVYTRPINHPTHHSRAFKVGRVGEEGGGAFGGTVRCAGVRVNLLFSPPHWESRPLHSAPPLASLAFCTYGSDSAPEHLGACPCRGASNSKPLPPPALRFN